VDTKYTTTKVIRTKRMYRGRFHFLLTVRNVKLLKVEQLVQI